MLRSKSFRVALAVLLVTGAVAIGVNYVSRRSPPPVGKRADLLTPEQSQNLTNAVYQERKSGLLRFEVRADWSSKTPGNVISLRNVSLTRVDEQGKPTSLVSGKEAVYDQDGKRITFTRDVHLKLADGTDVYSNSIDADLKSEVVNISETFRFQRGNASGSGQALEYRIEPKEVKVNGQFQLNLRLDEGNVEVRAAEAFHNLNTHVVELVGAATIEGAGNRLAADRIKVEMDEQNRLREINGDGNGRLEVGPGRSFAGEEIDMSFDPATDTLTRLEVHAGAAAQDRAVYLEQGTGGENYLEALQIIALPQKEDKAAVLKDFQADGNVLFRSQPMGISDSRAEHLEGAMAPGGKDLQKIHLAGTVSVVKESEDKMTQARITERLTSEGVDLRFEPGQTLKEAWAVRNVELKQTAPSLDRDLTATDSVHVFYRDGRMDRIESRGGCRLTELDRAGKRMVSAPSMDAFYAAGRLSRVTAERGVVVTTEENGITRTSTSETAEALYSSGQLTEVIQTGDVRIRDEEQKSRLELRAGTSRFDAKTAVLTLSGGTPVLHYWSAADDAQTGQETETTARQIRLFRDSDQIKAEGSVKTVLSQDGDLIVVESGRMEGDRKSGLAVYSGSPRITEKSGTVTGRVVRYNSQDQSVQVDDDVISSLADQQGKKYRVTSQHLVYDRQSGRARYQGLVEVTSTDVDLKAPFVELIFSGGKANQVSEVQAWGGVEVIQGQRRAKGPRAVYFPESQKMVMTAEEVAKK